MRRFVLGWKKLGLEQRLGSRIVTYADDLVILCKKGNTDQALQQLRKIMSKLQKLTVNERRRHESAGSRKGEFDFLGYTFRTDVLQRTGQARLGYRPSKKSIKRMVEKIHALTDRTGTWQETRKAGGQVEPHATRLGELLQGRHRQQGVSGHSTATQRCGCAGGCSSSTKPGVARAGPIHFRIFTGTLGSYA